MARAGKLAGIVALLVVVVVLASACNPFTGSKPTPAPSPSPGKPVEIVKPQPSVVSVSAATTGIFDRYYAIVDATIKNAGADGMVIVVGSITQGSETVRNELPIYLLRDATQTVRLVFPLKWKGGEWTPTVQTELP